MRKYVLLRSRQVLRLLPWILAAALLLSAAAAVCAAALQDRAGENDQKYRIALCGAEEDPLLMLGITALESLDETRHSVQILTMDEPEALQALKNGEIAAYTVIPQGFLESALGGDVQTMRFVTAPGGSAVNAVFQHQVTQVIADILLTAQKGSYGAYYALYENGSREQAITALNGLCIEYVKLALVRAEAHEVRILGIGSGLGLAEYLICGLAVLISCLLCLPFAPMLVQRDVSLGRLLAARGCSAVRQACVDLGCLLLGLWAVLGVIFALLACLGVSLPIGFLDMLPVALLAGAMSFLAFSVAAEMISGVMVQFLATAAMCFVSGCMYPVFFFPVAVQRLAAWLPTGLCREYLARCVTGESKAALLGAILLCAAVCVAAAVWLRRRRIFSERRAAA